MTKEKVTYEALTVAQQYALYRSVEAHYREVGEGRKGSEKKPIRLYSVAGSTNEALERKGLVTRAFDSYYRNYYNLTADGKRLGVHAFRDHRDDLDPREWASALITEREDAVKKADEETRKISNLFIGMTLRVEKKKKKLDEVVFSRLRHKGDGACFSSDEIRQIGEQIQNLVP